MFILFITVSILLIFIDQFTKYLAVTNLKPLYPKSIQIIDNVFQLTYVENSGAAFGILQNARIFFIIISIIILLFIIYYYIKLPQTKNLIYVKISLILIFSGALGNFIDRVKNGYVIDFFDFYLINFAVFNFADICVVVGTILLAFLLLFVIKDEEINL